jgi:hypothetical protein
MKPEWVVALKGYVMHVPTHTIECVKAYYEVGEYVSPANHEPVQVPVIELMDGNSFVAIEKNFIPLTDNEAGFFVFAQQDLKETLTRWVQQAAKSGIIPETIGILISASLRAQLFALMQTRKRFVEGGDVPPPPPTA